MTLFDAEDIDGPPDQSGSAIRLRMVVTYDGAPFHGFAANAGVTTVAGTLGAALERVVGHRVGTTCAGRTDKGVHARAQVVTVDLAAAVPDLELLARSLNRMCGPDVAVTDLAVVPFEFDARHSATARRYRYRAQSGGTRSLQSPLRMARG